MSSRPITSQHAAEPGRATHVVCPFCGLLCDDLSVQSESGAVRVTERGCAISRAGFDRQSALGPDTARVNGAPATLVEGARAAADILRRAQRPVIGGLLTDVAGMRAAVELADLCGAVLDHANSQPKFRNVLAFQDRGAITTTLAEARNRADLLVFVGTDVVSRFPRFFERLELREPSMFGLRDSDRRAIFIGAKPPAGAPQASESIECPHGELPDVLAALAALSGGADLRASQAGSVPMARLRQLVQTMSEARYGVLAWAAADLDFAHAELSVLAIFRTLMNLSRTTRFSGMPLAGNELTADAVLLWQVGFAFRTSFAGGRADYDPYLYSAQRLLAQREADALLWVSSLSDAPAPPTGGIPLIWLGGSAVAAPDAQVFFPVATPGLDHGGHLVRTDKVVTLHLAAQRVSQRPAAAQILHAIRDELRAC